MNHLDQALTKQPVFKEKGITGRSAMAGFSLLYIPMKEKSVHGMWHLVRATTYFCFFLQEFVKGMPKQNTNRTEGNSSAKLLFHELFFCIKCNRTALQELTTTYTLPIGISVHDKETNVTNQMVSPGVSTVKYAIS